MNTIFNMHKEAEKTLNNTEKKETQKKHQKNTKETQ